MKVIVNQYEIKKAVQLYLENVQGLKTTSFPELKIEDGKVSAEVQLKEEQK